MKFIILNLALAIALCNPTVAQQEIRTVPADQFSSILDSLSNYQLIDVRTASEFEQGHIHRAVQFDIKNEHFDDQIALLDPNRPVLLYCRSGKRSYQAAERLRERGFRNIINLDGGIVAWENSGHPIDRGE